MKKKYSKKPQKFREIALERINELFKQAKLMFKEDPQLSDRYAQLAKKISMKYKVKIPQEYKRRICKNCRKYLVAGVNCRVRTTRGHITYYCLDCKHFMRVRYK